MSTLLDALDSRAAAREALLLDRMKEVVQANVQMAFAELQKQQRSDQQMAFAELRKQQRSDHAEVLDALNKLEHAQKQLSESCNKVAPAEQTNEMQSACGPAVDLEDIEMVPHVQTMEVPVVLGMDGNEVTICIDDYTSFESVLERIKQMREHIGEEAGVRLLSSGTVVGSLESLIEHYLKGNKIDAIFIKDIDKMSLAAVAEEITCGNDEFKGHQFTLSKLPRGVTARVVADYLWENQILLTSIQLQILFDQLLPKFAGAARRGELILALHSFCLQQHHLWEPNDGSSECLWANMEWGEEHLPFSLRRLTRGRMTCWVQADAVDPSSVDQWPALDLCNLRDVAKAVRARQEMPLQAMRFVTSYGKNWRNLQ